MKLLATIIALFFTMINQAQQLVNSGFENWKTSKSKVEAVGWSPDLDAALYHSPSNNAVKGSYSLVLSTWYSYVEGHLYYGNHTNPDPREWTNYTVPFKFAPEKLTGYYRYTHTINMDDSAGCQLIIKDVKGDTLAYGEIQLDTSEHWIPFEITLKYVQSGRKPGSIAIHFVSSVNGGGMNDDSWPNRLYLDELKLVYRKQD